MFPRIMFDLPLDKEDNRFNELLEKAKENIKNEKELPSNDKTKDEVPLRAVANVSRQILAYSAFHWRARNRTICCRGRMGF